MMDYLYGEMSPSEREAYKSELDRSEDGQELAAMGAVRKFMAQSKDVDPGPAPVLVLPAKRRAIGRWWAVAATLLMLLVAGRLLGIQVKMDQRQFTMSFGPTEQVNPATMPSQDNYQAVLAAVASLRSEMNEKMDRLERPQLAQLATQDQLQALQTSLARSMNTQNSDLFYQVSDQLQRDQEAYTRSMIDELVQYLETQRREDLQLVNDGLQNLVQAIQLNSDDLAQFVNNPIQNY